MIADSFFAKELRRMPLFCRTLSALIAASLAIQMIGCTSLNDDEKTPVAVLVNATPPASGEIPANGTITVTFDITPKNVTVKTNAGKIGKTEIVGKTVTINGPFTPSKLILTITWADGEQTLNYTVTAPDPGDAKYAGETVIDPEVQPELTKSPFKVTDATFTELVLESESPIVVYFSADWCPPCRWMAPIIKEVASENRETFLIAKLDADQNPQTIREYRIDAMPTFIVFRDGKIIGRFVGGMQKAPLVQRILQAINTQGN